MEMGRRFLTSTTMEVSAEGELHPFPQVLGQRWEQKMRGGK